MKVPRASVLGPPDKARPWLVHRTRARAAVGDLSAFIDPCSALQRHPQVGFSVTGGIMGKAQSKLHRIGRCPAPVHPLRIDS
jgi:hypothetical protein